MASERAETALLPVVQKDGEDDDRKAASAMTKRGAYAAVSYMASAGSSFPVLLNIYLMNTISIS